MTDPNHLIDAVALAILNSDRAMAGLPPVASRDTIPDSDGYVVNARAVVPLVLEEAAKVADAEAVKREDLSNALIAERTRQ